MNDIVHPITRVSPLGKLIVDMSLSFFIHILIGVCSESSTFWFIAITIDICV